MADVLWRMVGEKFGNFRKRSAPCTRVTTHVQPAQKTAQRFSELFSRLRLESSRTTRCTFRRRHGHRQPVQPWRERPRPWPQAWQAMRPFRVVAHATGLPLATARAVRHQAGGTERRPMTTGCNIRGQTGLSSALTAPESLRATSKDPSTLSSPGGTPRAKGCSPPVFPLGGDRLSSRDWVRPLTLRTCCPAGARHWPGQSGQPIQAF
jgi:hypothetical protein